MSSILKTYMFPLGLFLLLLVGIFSLEWVIWGEDGVSLWTPVVAEYLRGSFENSQVIFGGQNLLAIYGELPFWKILKLLGASPIALLNITYFILLLFFYVLTLQIFIGLTSKRDPLSQITIFIYCLFSPILLNRVFAGHFNLLFGMLPLLVSLAYIYNRSWIFSLFCFCALICAFTIQSYQILAYHLFYFPILLLWLKCETGDHLSEYCKKLALITSIAILISSPIIYELFQHSSSPENLRSGISNIVYSYLISKPSDIASLVMSSVNRFTTRDNFFLFHELNYPLGLTFFSVFFLKGNHRKILLGLFITMALLFGFSANWPILNGISHLPFIELFRVPQRSLMLAAYIAPLFILVCFKEYLNLKSLGFLLAFILLGNGIDAFDLFCLIIVVMMFLVNKWRNYPELYFALIFSTLFLGLPEKYVAIRDSNELFHESLEVMLKIDKKIQLSKIHTKIHIEPASYSLIAAANYIGIPTAEGYGHPPLGNFNKVIDLLPLKIDPMTNVFMLNDFHEHPNFQKALGRLGIEKIIVIGEKGDFKQVSLRL